MEHTEHADNNSTPPPIKVWWTNLATYSQEEFSNLDAALAYAKEKGFEACFDQGNTRLASWTIFGGFRRLDWTFPEAEVA